MDTFLRYILIACFVVRLAPLHAQFSIGHRAGVAWSTWEQTFGEDDPASNYAAGKHWNPGVAFDIPVTWSFKKHLQLTSGVGWTQKGFGFPNESVHLNYLELPLLAGYAFHFGRFTLAPRVGAAYGWFMRGTQHYDGTGPYGTFGIGREGDADYYYKMPDHELMLTTALSAAYAFHDAAITLDLGYQHGLTDMLYGPTISRYDETAMNRTVTVQLGYAITLGAKHTVPDTARSSAPAPPAVFDHRIMIGQRGGLTLSHMSFAASLPSEEDRVIEGAKPLEGVTSALMVRIPLTAHWALRPEVAYTQKGWQCQWYPRPMLGNDLLRMNYLEVPLTIEYALLAKPSGPYLLFAPVISRGLGGVDRFGRVLSDPNEYLELATIAFGNDVRYNEYAPWDFSLSGGAGYAFALRNARLLAEVRYQHSFSNVYQEGMYALYSDDVTAMHRNWSFSIGYLFAWKTRPVEQ